ncbi:Clp protease ClpP [Dysgonomonas sp. ZJ279]|uniref:Clp protease ClpP n=1 Tax=Dysgonomonas sp. ZJ279 TaxID=2709796 RepID=UPI0013E9F8F5|nr:ATP-dependent Clp protease proteolytic subunit [Dysgonomonas sp. ZJ279]
MEKIPFNIHASTQAQTALIRITGTIGWDTDCELFRARIDAIAQQGITDAHLYLNGPGGSCFDAEEIVNIIKSVFTGKVTGEGGALVASAYTRIAMVCETFTMPENGMFMIHKPAGYTGGTAAKIESYLKLLKNIESQYIDLYTTKATDKAELNKQWEIGDWWLTAKEAKANGFITIVKEKAKIDAETTALISACGCPESKIPIINNKKEVNEMDLKTMALNLGLPESATEVEINAAIAKGKKAQEDLQALQLVNEQKAKADKEVKIKATLEKAIGDKRITADMRANWEKMLNADFDTANASLTGLSPVKKVNVTTSSAESGKSTYEGKTFAELQDEDPDALAELEKNDPEAFIALYNASLKK